MRSTIIAAAAGVLILFFLIDARPGHAQMMGWGTGMCREGYVYEPSRNVCVHQSKKAKRRAVKRKAPQ